MVRPRQPVERRTAGLGLSNQGTLRKVLFKVLDPYPTKIKVVLNAQTKKILGCLAIGNQALEIVNLCSILLTSDTSPDQLNRYRFVHSSPAEALQRCVNSVAAA
jgi:pyridine nucleotide-disulfide oxidoreductase